MNNMKQTQDDRTIQPFNCSTIQRVKAYAFTLAETLIVIGIIGVVAALTLPNLNHATGDKEKVTKVKKIYASLTDAFDRAQAIYGQYDEWGKGIEDPYDLRTLVGERITEFMKVSKVCGLDGEGCFSHSPLLVPVAYEWEDEDGNFTTTNVLEADFSVTVSGTYKVLLSDGTSLAINEEGDEAGNLIALRIKADIDGPNKGKTQEGNDIFDFVARFPNGQLNPSDSPEFWTGEFGYGYVTAWVINNGNLDYLKCPDELNWETQTSCK